MPIQDYYDFKERSIIRRKGSDARVFLLSGRAWTTIETSMFATFSTGAAVMLEEMGRSYGEDIGKEGLRMSANPTDVIGAVQKLAEVSGWGTAVVEGDTRGGTSLTISLAACVFCSETTRSQGAGASCHFLVGVVKGLVDVLYGKGHRVVESQCCSQGAGACKFDVTTGT